MTKMAEAMLKQSCKKDLSFGLVPDTPKSNTAILGGRKMSGSLVMNPSLHKKQKLAKPTTDLIRKAAEGISHAVSRSERLSAIGAACATFDHDFSNTHDEEIRLFGADSVLYKHLALLFLKKSLLEEKENSSSKNTNIHVEEEDEDDVAGINEEIGYTCSALEMVCRCNASALSESFSKFGHELLELLLLIITKFFKTGSIRMECYNFTSDRETVRKDSAVSWDLVGTESHTSLTRLASNGSSSSASSYSICISKATKIMCHLARVGLATEPMAKHPNVLYSLKNIIDTVKKDDCHNYQEARLNSLWVLANLACAPGNMVYIARFPGMIDSLLKVVVQNGRCSGDDALTDTSLSHLDARYQTRCIAARAQAVRAFLNLSWCEENKVPFSEISLLIDALMKLINKKRKRRTEEDDEGEDDDVSMLAGGRTTIQVIKSTRRHAAGTLRNIAAVRSSQHKLLLCHYKSGALLDTLRIVASLPPPDHHDEEGHYRPTTDDNDDAIRDRVYATLFNLCCEDTLECIKMQPGLIKTLEQVVALPPPNDAEDDAGVDKDANTRALVERILQMFDISTAAPSSNRDDASLDNEDHHHAMKNGSVSDGCGGKDLREDTDSSDGGHFEKTS